MESVTPNNANLLERIDGRAEYDMAQENLFEKIQGNWFRRCHRVILTKNAK